MDAPTHLPHHLRQNRVETQSMNQDLRKTRWATADKQAVLGLALDKYVSDTFDKFGNRRKQSKHVTDINN